jgi:hypothetical protein
MTEAQIVQRILRALNRDRQVRATKVHGGPNQTTMLDIVVCAYGRYIELEVKRPGKERTLTERQKLRMQRVAEAGGRTALVTSVPQALEVVYE